MRKPFGLIAVTAMILALAFFGIGRFVLAKYYRDTSLRSNIAKALSGTEYRVEIRSSNIEGLATLAFQGISLQRHDQKTAIEIRTIALTPQLWCSLKHSALCFKWHAVAKGVRAPISGVGMFLPSGVLHSASANIDGLESSLVSQILILFYAPAPIREIVSRFSTKISGEIQIDDFNPRLNSLANAKAALEFEAPTLQLGGLPKVAVKADSLKLEFRDKVLQMKDSWSLSGKLPGASRMEFTASFSGILDFKDNKSPPKTDLNIRLQSPPIVAIGIMRIFGCSPGTRLNPSALLQPSSNSPVILAINNKASGLPVNCTANFGGQP